MIDLNVIVDGLQRREPFYAMSARARTCPDAGTVDGWVVAHSLTTWFSLLAKSESVKHARATLSELMTFLSVAAVDQAVIEQALNQPYQDFEDAVQMMAAVRTGAQYVVTRRVRDYESGPLPVLQSVELLALV